MTTAANDNNPAIEATTLEVVMAKHSFSSRIRSASSWEVASDIYMEARAVLSRDSEEWARCVAAMHERQGEAPLDTACLYWVRV